MIVFIFPQHPISRQTLNSQMIDTVIPTQLLEGDIEENQENSGDLSLTFDHAPCARWRHLCDFTMSIILFRFSFASVIIIFRSRNEIFNRMINLFLRYINCGTSYDMLITACLLIPDSVIVQFLKSRYLSEFWISWSASFRERLIHFISVATTPMTRASDRWSDDRGRTCHRGIATVSLMKWTRRLRKLANQAIQDSERYLLF